MCACLLPRASKPICAVSHRQRQECPLCISQHNGVEGKKGQWGILPGLLAVCCWRMRSAPHAADRPVERHSRGVEVIWKAQARTQALQYHQ